MLVLILEANQEKEDSWASGPPSPDVTDRTISQYATCPQSSLLLATLHHPCITSFWARAYFGPGTLLGSLHWRSG